jgi:sterol desaturase/sphingolipid hydroxylase (fatty acid hydroxylase superfamily)
MAISVPYRAAQVALIGVDNLSLTAWQTFLSLSILLHHSNLNLGNQGEQYLARFVVTPRMHGLHHSRDPREANANWSSGLSAWDWLHRTFRLDLAQQPEVGVRGIESPEQVVLGKILLMPWKEPPEIHQYLTDSKGESRHSRPLP